MNDTARAVRPRKIRIGDLLIEQSVITQDQLNVALAAQQKTGRKLGRVLIESGIVEEEQLLTLLSRQLNVPYIDLKRYEINPETVRSISETHARRFRVLALDDTADGLVIGMADPTDIFAYDELARIIHRPLLLAVVKESDLLRTIDIVYRRTQEISGLAAQLENEVSAYDIDLGELVSSATADAPVVKLLQTIFEDAVQVNASDIHIEPDERELRIRFRIDGVLRVQTTADPRIASALVSRVKLIAGLDISEKRLPQDGRCNIHLKDKNIDVRLSTVPVQHGESVVMRLLNQANGILDLDRIGMPPAVLDRFRRLINAPNGMVLVTGPTGSGKTTTLYGALRELNRPSSKLVTVEDPVEYRMPGVNQIQVHPKIDLTFSRVLRSVLRQDPDIILVGEMRDTETVEIGLRAAMTGHLVLSSLHTNDAISTAVRLLDMGAAAYLVAASLRGILSQRLVRRICEACSEPAKLSAAALAIVRHELGERAESVEFRRGRGCTFCNNNGYHGRTGIYEFLEIDDGMVAALQNKDLLEFARHARQQPQFQSLRRSAMELAAQGSTTLDQVMRATHALI